MSHVWLSQLQAEFKPFESWSDLNNEESNLVKFLTATCKYEGDLKKQGGGDEEPEGVAFHELKLKTLGLMWCHGSKEERATQFYGMV